jgi:ubiquinone/menaquinone biosynthesis C-methylase UbiE
MVDCSSIMTVSPARILPRIAHMGLRIRYAAGMDEDRTRASYDHVARTYAAQGMDDLAAKPFDRDIVTEFARRVGPGGVVLDLGCGPGRVTRFLHDQGLDVTGLDLSPEMIAAARTRFPELRFEVASMFALPYSDGSINGLAAMYSIIHIPRADQPALFRELHRVLAPGGWLLLAYHLGAQDRHVGEWVGQPVDMEFLVFAPGEIETRLAEAGFTNLEPNERNAYPEHEFPLPRNYLLAQSQPITDH